MNVEVVIGAGAGLEVPHKREVGMVIVPERVAVLDATKHDEFMRATSNSLVFLIRNRPKTIAPKGALPSEYHLSVTPHADLIDRHRSRQVLGDILDRDTGYSRLNQPSGCVSSISDRKHHGRLFLWCVVFKRVNTEHVDVRAFNTAIL
jgi:hypothetical protein